MVMTKAEILAGLKVHRSETNAAPQGTSSAVKPGPLDSAPAPDPAVAAPCIDDKRSDTPLTDALVESTAAGAKLVHMIGLARQLERELATARSATHAELLREAREYILHKAQRHDLYWRDGHEIMDRIDSALADRRDNRG